MLNKRLLAQVIRYFLGACAGLSADWLIWLVACGLGFPPIAAQCLGKAIGAIVAFHLYRTRVFVDLAPQARHIQACRFLIAAVVAWCVGVLLFAELSAVIHPALAKIAADGVTFMLNWFVMRYWVFIIGTMKK